MGNRARPRCTVRRPPQRARLFAGAQPRSQLQYCPRRENRTHLPDDTESSRQTDQRGLPSHRTLAQVSVVDRGSTLGWRQHQVINATKQPCNSPCPPASTSASANVNPSPRAPPVTMKTRPSSSNSRRRCCGPASERGSGFAMDESCRAYASLPCPFNCSCPAVAS